MFKKILYYLVYYTLFVIGQVSYIQSASALEFTVSPFALYEQGQENIYIDGVRTKYGLGVLGVEIDTILGSGFSFWARTGYGYHPKANVSLTVEGREVAVTGPVSGVYLGGAINYLVWAQHGYSVSSELSFVARNVDAPDLVGTAGSRAITGTAVNDFDTIDLVLSSEIPINEKFIINLNGGLSQWNLKTTAVAYAQTGSSGSFSCPCSFTKRIDSTSIDPIFAISINNRNTLHNLDLELYSRSLRSKAGTGIIGMELEYKFTF